jgi:hypothetical protein
LSAGTDTGGSSSFIAGRGAGEGAFAAGFSSRKLDFFSVEVEGELDLRTDPSEDGGDDAGFDAVEPRPERGEVPEDAGFAASRVRPPLDDGGVPVRSELPPPVSAVLAGAAAVEAAGLPPGVAGLGVVDAGLTGFVSSATRFLLRNGDVRAPGGIPSRPAGVVPTLHPMPSRDGREATSPRILVTSRGAAQPLLARPSEPVPE